MEETYYPISSSALSYSGCPRSASAATMHRYLTGGSDDAACFQDGANARASPLVRVRVRHRCDVKSELLLDLVPYLEGNVCRMMVVFVCKT